MKTKTILLVAILGITALFLSACEFSFSTANIANAYMAADGDGAQPTTAFAQDAIFYAIVDLANASDETTVKAVWVAVKAEDVEPEFVIDETTLTSGDAILTFSLENAPDTLWPLGQYRVDIYLNDELDTSLAFEVQ
jgi:hypothetical protein